MRLNMNAKTNRVMEAGDHFKNGASSKSQTSRGNFLRTWTKETIFMSLIPMMMAVVLLGGCKEDEKTEKPTPPTTGINGVITDISGKGVYAANVEYGVVYQGYDYDCDSDCASTYESSNCNGSYSSSCRIYRLHFDVRQRTISNMDGSFELKEINTDLSEYTNNYNYYTDGYGYGTKARNKVCGYFIRVSREGFIEKTESFLGGIQAGKVTSIAIVLSKIEQ